MLDGKALAKRLREELKEKFAAFTAARGYAPTVAIFRIGSDEASAITLKGNTFNYTFPAHSFTQLIIKTAF